MNASPLLVAGGVSLLIGVSCFSLLMFFQSAWQGIRLKQRSERYLAPHAGELTDPSASERVEFFLATSDRGRGILQRIRDAGLDGKPGVLVLKVLGLSLVLFLLGAVFFNSFVSGIVLAIGGLVVPYMWLERKAEQRWQRFLEQLPEALNAMSSALRAGASIRQALEQVVQELQSPIRDEFAIAVEEIKIGKGLEEVLDEMRNRIPVRALDSILATVLIQRRSGGNLAELLNEASTLLKEDVRLEREMRIQTAQSVLSARVVGFVPVALFLMLYFMNRSYLQPMLESIAGMFMLTVAAIFTVAGFIAVQKLGQIKE